MRRQVRWTHEARFAPAPGSPAAARRFVSRHLVKHDLGHLVDDVRLVVSELVTNAALHGRSASVVKLELMPPCVRLSVHDNAGGLPLLRKASSGDLNGRGLQVVERFSTEWGVQRSLQGGKTVWASFLTQH